MTVVRTNLIGFQYLLTKDSDHQTTITHRGTGHKITVPHAIDHIDNSWFAWTRGELIQRAFNYLTVDQREFIMIGMTPEEFDVATRED